MVLNSNPGFHYDTTKKYTIKLSCTDGKNSPVYGYFKLFLQRNARPYLDNIPGKFVDILNFKEGKSSCLPRENKSHGDFVYFLTS